MTLNGKISTQRRTGPNKGGCRAHYPNNIIDKEKSCQNNLAKELKPTMSSTFLSSVLFLMRSVLAISCTPIPTVIKMLIIFVISLANRPPQAFGQLTGLSRSSSPQDYPSSSVSGSSSALNGNSAGTSTVVGSGEVLGPKSFPLNSQEPTCEELRAMWRFSKRQSRAAEITNEIPTYRDPFAYNVWEPYYPTSRSLGGMRVVPRYRDSNRPVYGRIVHREPVVRTIGGLPILDGTLRHRQYAEDSHRPATTYGAESRSFGGGAGISSNDRSRFPLRLRFSANGGGGAAGNSNSGAAGGYGQNAVIGGVQNGAIAPHHGSFQRLKELIWTERAKDLAKQRKAEEMAARIAVLKEVTNGHQSYNSRRQHMQNASPLMDENRSPSDSDVQGEMVAAFHGGSAFRHISGGSGLDVAKPDRAVATNRAGGLTGSNLMDSAQSAKTFGHKMSHFRERSRSLSPLISDIYRRQQQKRYDVSYLEQLLPYRIPKDLEDVILQDYADQYDNDNKEQDSPEPELTATSIEQKSVAELAQPTFYDHQSSFSQQPRNENFDYLLD